MYQWRIIKSTERTIIIKTNATWIKINFHKFLTTICKIVRRTIIKTLNIITSNKCELTSIKLNALVECVNIITFYALYS